MKHELIVVSGSSIQDYQNDPLRWCYRWLEDRVPKGNPQALTVGKMIHSAFEDYFNEKRESPGAWLQILINEAKDTSLLDERDTKALKELEGLVEPLKHWVDMYPIEDTLEIEEPFEFPIGKNLKFQGRPDRVVVVHGNVMHMQHKTIGASGDVGLFISTARRSLHELIYGWHLEQKYCDEIPPCHIDGQENWTYGGTIYNIIRKLKYKSTAKGKEGKILHEPQEFFLQHLVGISRDQQNQALEDLEVLAQQMRVTASDYLSGRTVPSNRGRDRGPFGNSNDLYTRVMLGEIDLSDNEFFTDKENLYAIHSA